jgi:hypothetical protein
MHIPDIDDFQQFIDNHKEEIKLSQYLHGLPMETIQGADCDGCDDYDDYDAFDNFGPPGPGM